jgi:hypothetical protein
VELPDEVVDLVHRALHDTGLGEATDPVGMSRVMDLQEEALAALEQLHVFDQ